MAQCCPECYEGETLTISLSLWSNLRICATIRSLFCREALALQNSLLEENNSFLPLNLTLYIYIYIYIQIVNLFHSRITRINICLFHKNTHENSLLGRAQQLRTDLSLGQCKPHCHSALWPEAALTGTEIWTYIYYSKPDKVRAQDQTPAQNYA